MADEIAINSIYGGPVSINASTNQGDEEGVIADATNGNIVITAVDAKMYSGRNYYVDKVDASANTVTFAGIVIAKTQRAYFYANDGTWEQA